MTTATRAETSWGRFRADFQAELLTRIPEHLGRLSWSAGQIESAQRDGLRRLLAHAVAHSPFHRQRLAGTGSEPIPVPGRYMALATGGSTGQRGVFVFDPAAKAEFILSIIRSLLARLGAAGGIPPGGLPTAMVGAGSAVHATGAAAAETIGPDAPLRVLPVPVTLPWLRIVDRLNALQAPCLIGFASALARLAAEQR